MGNLNRWAPFGGAALLLCNGAAWAELSFNPYVTAQHEYHSNIFAMPENPVSGEKPFDDNIQRALAGVETRYAFSAQTLRAAAEGRRVQFQRFNNLDHDEHLLSGGLDWKLFSNLEGTVEARSEERMAPFADRESTELAIEKDRSGRASFNVGLTPSWRTVFGARHRELNSPLPDFPGFGLTETGFSAGLEYALESALIAGLTAERANGTFEGIDGGSRYQLNTAQFTARYTANGLSSFNGELGYSVIRAEDDPDLEDVSGITGALGYQRQLSGVTDFDLQVFRRVNSYIAGANATTDFGASAALNWKPTMNLTTSAGYSWTRNLFGVLATQAAAEEGRQDERHDVSLKLNYQALRWLAINGYGLLRERESNINTEDYSETVIGVALTARWP